MDLQAMRIMFHDVSFEVVRSTSRAYFHMKSRLASAQADRVGIKCWVVGLLLVAVASLR